jgi:hypothetical protein
MSVQDLTPQLRTRLSRVEKTVGWFVILATLLMFSGFFFYLYHTAERKGWFLTKVRYFTLADTATGLKVGDPVKLMGFDVGEITRIDAQDPEDMFNVYVEFRIKSPYYGYLWSEGSRARLDTADFLGGRAVEVTKGSGGAPTYIHWPLRVVSPADLRDDAKLKDLWLGQRILRRESDQVIAPAGQPLTAELLEQLTGAGLDRIRITNTTEKAALEISVAEAERLPGRGQWQLIEELRWGLDQQVLIPAMRPLTREIVNLLAGRGVTTFRVIDKSETKKGITAVWQDKEGYYWTYTKKTGPYWLPPDEAPALAHRLEALANEVERALPSILNLTNQLTAVLNSATQMTANANSLLTSAQPVMTNVAAITGLLREPKGAFGEWMLPTNLHQQLLTTLTNASTTLDSANSTLITADTNLAAVSMSLNATLINLANITSNLNQQVQTNDQIVSYVSRAITNADSLMQGLKRHWLFRSAFKDTDPKTKSTNPARRPPPPRVGKHRD